MQAAINSLATIVDNQSLHEFIFGGVLRPTPRIRDGDNAYTRDETNQEYIYLTTAIYPGLSIILQHVLDATNFTALYMNQPQQYHLDIDSYIQKDDLCRQFVDHLIIPRRGPLELKRTFNTAVMSVSHTEHVQLPGFDLDAEVIWYVDQNNKARIININILYRV